VSGQHVGRQSDALVEDEDLSAARRNQQLLANAVKPRALPRKSQGIGDGDRCPLDPEHGKMFVIRGTDRQHCPDQAHDGTPGKDGAPQTRAFWPLHGFNAAVAEYTANRTPVELPDINMEGFDA